jgi:hypothetical protein
MLRLAHAPNIAIAQLWADMLNGEGIETSVQRYFISSIAGDMPPDQCLPELWVMQDAQLPLAKQVLHQLQHLPQRHWVCTGCSETVEGGFMQCWNCGLDETVPAGR